MNKWRKIKKEPIKSSKNLTKFMTKMLNSTSKENLLTESSNTSWKSRKPSKKLNWQRISSTWMDIWSSLTGFFQTPKLDKKPHWLWKFMYLTCWLTWDWQKRTLRQEQNWKKCWKSTERADMKFWGIWVHPLCKSVKSWRLCPTLDLSWICCVFDIFLKLKLKRQNNSNLNA